MSLKPNMPSLHRSFTLLLVTCLMLPWVASHAQSGNSSLQTYLQKAETLELAQHRLWQGLLHLEKGKSQIESKAFFLSGKRPPDKHWDLAHQELQASLQAFFQPVTTNTANHARCRFPARYLWLDSKLGMDLPELNCEGFQDYALNGEIDSISMVFVAGHFKSPASFFGHNLLKFNSRKTRAEGLLEPTINYGAIVPDGEAPLRYIMLGIVGGYQAHFTRDQFFRVYQLYAERELRDIWEYPLNLSATEIDLVVAHAWELTNMKLTYYFFRENCAYQIASLLNIVLEDKLVPAKLPWSMPYNVFDNLVQAQRDGKPFVGELIYHPSRKSRFEEQYLQLTSKQRNLVRGYINSNGGMPLEQTVTGNSPADQADNRVAVVDTLLDYYQYRIRADNRPLDRKLRNQLLLMRLTLPVVAEQDSLGEASLNDDQGIATRGSATAANTSKPAPHLGQRPTMIRLISLHNDSADPRASVNGVKQSGRSISGLQIHLRPAYYDLLNIDAGRLKFSSFSMLDTKFSLIGEKVRFDALQLVSALNLNPPSVALADDAQKAWHFSVGAKNDSLDCKSCTVAYVRGGMGGSIRLSQEAALYAMAGLHLQSSYNNSGHIAVEAMTGITGQITKNWRAHSQWGIRQFLDGSKKDRSFFRIDNRFGTSRAYDFRLTYEYHQAQELSFGTSFYF